MRIVQDNQTRKKNKKGSSVFFESSILAQPPSVEHVPKTRYQTRYSTRLAGTMVTEELIASTSNRRTARLTPE